MGKQNKVGGLDNAVNEPKPRTWFLEENPEQQTGSGIKF